MAEISTSFDARLPASGAGTGQARTAADAVRTEEIDEAARAFEKLLVQRMLGDMRRAARGGEDASNAMGNWESMFDEEIAGVVTRSGGLGFADALSRSLGGSGSVALVQRKAPTGLPEKDLIALRKLATSSTAPDDASEPRHSPSANSIDRVPAGLVRAQRPGTSLPDASSVSDAHEQSMLESGFIAPLRKHAERNAQRLGTRPEAILAVAALETGWGRHPIVDAQGTDSHNLFGIKATGASRADGIEHRTTEFIGGAPRRVEATFQRFGSVGEAVDGFADFLLENPRYAPALEVADDPERFLRALHRAGYATDPHYADKAVELLKQVQTHLEQAQPASGPAAPRHPSADAAAPTSPAARSPSTETPA